MLRAINIRFIKWGGQFLAFCGQKSMDMFLFHSVEFAFIIGGIKTGLEVIIHSSNIIAIINIILNLLLQFTSDALTFASVFVTT